MKVTLQEIYEALPVFSVLLNKKGDFKTSYRLNKILAQIRTDLKMIDETRQEIIKKHGGVLKNNNFEFPEGNEQKFVDEFREFLKTETDISASQIPFECMEKFELSALDISKIEKFIEDEQEQRNGKPETKKTG